MSNNPIYNQPLTGDQNYSQFHQQYPQSPYTQPSYTQNGYPQYGNYQENLNPQGYSPTYTPSFTPQQQYANNTYNYDMEHIQYQPMTIDNWSQIPNDPSPYSQMWESPQSFQPQTFSINTKSNHRYNDLGWLIAFWINFAATVGVIAWICISYKDYLSNDDYRPNYYNNNRHDDEPGDLDSNDLLKTLGFGFLIAVALNIFHYCFCTFAPVAYIHVGLIVNIIVSILLCILPVLTGNYWFILYPVINVLFSICIYCCCRKYIKLSAEILRVTCKILCRYPSYFFLVFLESIWESVICVAFTLAFYFVSAANITYFIYIYLVFSYFWITITFGYVTYMIGAGLGSSWYFLNNTEYFPSSPVWESFKRSMTTSFGSASLAGFLLAVVNTLRAIIQSGDTSSDNSTTAMVLCVLKCIALCILNVLEACISFINRYALIYCATFGVPFKEGCRRWCELSCHKFVDVIMSGNCISLSLVYNGLVFVVGAGLLGYGLGYLLYKDTDKVETAELIICIFAVCFTLSIFAIFLQPVSTVSDTLLVCFAEEPNQMKTADNSLYEKLKEFYSEALNERL
ncbi:hypothetical protein M9Y10_010511 [Tritrichomonas musculus]|uniref:Choline transporter-like protein n=1 Tax=Tritrichomonas musculus TaxID=1915356 RepID=A0ABR2IM48_9EUKA